MQLITNIAEQKYAINVWYSAKCPKNVVLQDLL